MRQRIISTGVIVLTVLAALGAAAVGLVSLLSPSTLPGEPVNRAGQLYADYLGVRNLAMALMLLVAAAIGWVYGQGDGGAWRWRWASEGGLLSARPQEPVPSESPPAE